MTVLAFAILAMGPRVTVDLVDNWVTLPESNMQVELHLYTSGLFEAHEYWTGAQSKPMPNSAMRGRWKKEGSEIELDIRKTSGAFAGATQDKTKTLQIRSVHLLWMDALKHEHSLSKTSRKPAKIEFGSER